MAAVEVTIRGTLYDKTQRTAQQVVLIGDASITGLSIGGGPVAPEEPPGTWGGADEPLPTPPINLPPEQPPPDGPPDSSGFIKPPPPNGGWGFHIEYGWLYSPPGAGPKGRWR